MGLLTMLRASSIRGRRRRYLAAFAILVATESAAPAQDDPCPDRPGMALHALNVGGIERSFCLYRSAVAAAKPDDAALVIALHGGSSRARGMDRLTGFSRLADREGFVLVLPNGVDKQWNDGRGIDSYRAHREKVDDVAFIASLIDEIARRMPIDPSRVYVAGMSNGGLMAHRLACEIPEKIAAIAPVEGLVSQRTAQACPGKLGVPMLLIKGSDAPTFEKTSVRLSAFETTKLWGRINGCRPTPVESWLPDRAADDGTKTRRVEFPGCSGGADVVWLDVQHGGHTWPGGYQYLPEAAIGRISRDFDATEMIWRFFQAHRRTRESTGKQ